MPPNYDETESPSKISKLARLNKNDLKKTLKDIKKRKIEDNNNTFGDVADNVEKMQSHTFYSNPDIRSNQSHTGKVNYFIIFSLIVY